MSTVRIAFLSDTHLGNSFSRDEIRNSYCGEDYFFRAYRIALEIARERQADFIVHGGDVFYRSKIPPYLVDLALTPLVELAIAGIPVLVVPGNHERSQIPRSLFTTHQNLHIFSEPRSIVLEKNGLRMCFAGFPYTAAVRANFTSLLRQTNAHKTDAHVKFLVLHQLFEGSTVGPSDFMFTNQPDVIAAHNMPKGFAAVLCGHVHRHQVLREDLWGQKLACEVLFAGSTERTSFAELNETKGIIMLELASDGSFEWEFCPLPARPMHSVVLDCANMDIFEATQNLISLLNHFEENACIRVCCVSASQQVENALRASLRSGLSSSMQWILLKRQT